VGAPSGAVLQRGYNGGQGVEVHGECNHGGVRHGGNTSVRLTVREGESAREREREQEVSGGKTLRNTATHYNTLQHTATRHNTLHHTAPREVSSGKTTKSSRLRSAKNLEKAREGGGRGPPNDKEYDKRLHELAQHIAQELYRSKRHGATDVKKSTFR